MELDLFLSLLLETIASSGMRHPKVDAVGQIARINSLAGIIQLATSR